MSDRQKLFYALLASAFFHLVAFLLLAMWSAQHASEVVKALPDLTQLTVTIMPPKPAAPPRPPSIVEAAPKKLPPNMRRPVLDSDGLNRSAKAPAHPVFQSDSNMVAGSQLPATGNIPLPSEAGPNRKFMDFANQAATSGKGQSPQESTPARQSAAPAASMPEQYPYGITHVQQSATALAKAADQPKPTPNPTSKPTPAPTVAPNSLALGKTTPTPAPQLPSPIGQLARLMTQPALRGQADMAPMTTTPPAPPAAHLPEPPTQRETEKTRINGGITALGPAGVDAVETPFGRYHRKLSNLIGSRWKLYLQEHPKDVGDVTILVKLNTNGKVTSTRVVSNHSLDDLGELSTRAIMESDLPPVPDDLAPMLRDGKLEISFNFNVYDASNDSPGR